MEEQKDWQKIIKTLITVLGFVATVSMILARLPRIIAMLQDISNGFSHDDLCDCPTCDGVFCNCRCHGSQAVEQIDLPTKAELVSQPVESPSKPVAESEPFQLNSRQEKIYDMIRDKGAVGMKDISKKVSKVTSRTIRRDLTKLEKLGLIKQVGRTKDSVYKLKE